MASSDSTTAVAPKAGAHSISQVIVHPIVLLSVVDHYNRVARDTSKRVVGVLLGERSHGTTDTGFTLSNTTSIDASVSSATEGGSVGTTAGTTRAGDVIDVTTSYAVPFEEDPSKPGIWYLDHNFLEAMASMFHKVNCMCEPAEWD